MLGMMVITCMTGSAKAMEEGNEDGCWSGVLAGTATLGAVWMGAARARFWDTEETVAKGSGDVELEGKREGSLRLVVGNIRRVKQEVGGAGKETDARKVANMNEAMADMQADMVGLIDTGLEDGSTPSRPGSTSAGSPSGTSAERPPAKGTCSRPST